MQSNATQFNSEYYQTEKEFSDFESGDLHGKANKGLWEVNDNDAKDLSRRFQRQESALIDLLCDSGKGSMGLEWNLPKQCELFIRRFFLERLNIRESSFINLNKMMNYIFTTMDVEEPYFFLVDMPVHLSQDADNNTYRDKKTHSTLNPETIEIFKIKFGWNFPHYTYVHSVLADKRTEAIARGEFVAHPSMTRNMDIEDVFEMLSIIWAAKQNDVTGKWEPFWEVVKTTIERWKSSYYEEMLYDATTREEKDKIEEAEERDYWAWIAVSIGVMTWLKSPHGLKFLIETHPIYEQLLYWDYDALVPGPRPEKDTGGFAVISGWNIYTARDLEVLPGVKPGTCSVSGQTLHCTQLVNANAVKHPCFCGKRRDYLEDSEWRSQQDHPYASCKEWHKLYGKPSMHFISYAALYNQLSGCDPQTRCQRHMCPNTSCGYHAGYAARIHALTENRTRMLTSVPRT